MILPIVSLHLADAILLLASSGLHLADAILLLAIAGLHPADAILILASSGLDPGCAMPLLPRLLRRGLLAMTMPARLLRRGILLRTHPARRHSREGGESRMAARASSCVFWIPAFAGMTAGVGFFAIHPGVPAGSSTRNDGAGEIASSGTPRNDDAGEIASSGTPRNDGAGEIASSGTPRNDDAYSGDDVLAVIARSPRRSNLAFLAQCAKLWPEAGLFRANVCP